MSSSPSAASSAEEMSIVELFILAVGLSMDAFAVSICKGLSLGKIKPKHMCIAGAWFGGFQALMPLIGYYLGSLFADMVTRYSHWVAFALLLAIGGNMIKESLGEEENVSNDMGFKSMLLLAIATSIDALAVGVSLAFLKVAILPAVLFIGCITFVCSAAGVKIGSIFGDKYQSNNAVFVGTDAEGVPRHAHKRSANSYGKAFRLNVEGSDPRYSFHHIGTDRSLYVFEAPIDMLSYITLYPEDWQRHSYVACCGTSIQPVLQMLEQTPQLDTVLLCLDNDEAGHQASRRMREQLETHYSVERLISENKDWNDDLTLSAENAQGFVINEMR